MANYSLRHRRGRYFARYTDARGKRVEMALDARTKRQAHALAAELAHAAYRVRVGLDKEAEHVTLHELWRRYVPIARRKSSFPDMRQRYLTYVRDALGEQLVHLIEPSDIERVVAEVQARGRSPRTAEHVRVLLSAVFNFGIKKERILRGENPARIAAPPKLVPHVPRFLERGSISLMLRAAPWWSKGRYPVKAMLAVLVYLGVRKGELLGLKPGDVDLPRSLVWIARSYDEPTTKDGKSAPAAIAPELVPYLVWALENCRGEWLFSRPDGSMMRPNTKTEVWLRKALVDAGLIRGFRLYCVSRGLRKSCGFSERRQDGTRTACPRCGGRLSAEAIPLDLSTKDMRATWTTHFVELTGDIDAAARQLRHSSTQLTATRYRFARDRHLVEQVARLTYETSPLSLPPSCPPNSAETDETEPIATERLN